MYALSDEERQHLIRLALMLICGATAILPFTVPPTSASVRAQASNRAATITVPEMPGRLEFPSITVKRDPFVTDAAALPSQASYLVPVSNSNKSNEIGIVLPPNDGAQGGPPSLSSTVAVPVVRGIVLGDAPQALVEVGGTIKVVSVGDSVANETVRSIDASGLLLSSGLRLRVTNGSQ